MPPTPCNMVTFRGSRMKLPKHCFCLPPPPRPFQHAPPPFFFYQSWLCSPPLLTRPNWSFYKDIQNGANFTIKGVFFQNVPLYSLDYSLLWYRMPQIYILRFEEVINVYRFMLIEPNHLKPEREIGVVM